CHQRSNYPWTF
nr:immunoglobulin light chain junction region [Mus musculus]NSM02255.1 immunoglobulin light chain junction region [Mus musculus]